MKIGFVGLGKMGSNMTVRLLRAGHQVVVYDINPQSVNSLAEEGATPASSLEDLVSHLPQPRAIWIMLPSGEITETSIETLAQLLTPDDIILDGGNSYYKDTIRKAATLRQKRLHFIDVGTSGGIWGLSQGYSLMIGGEEEQVKFLSPIFEALAPSANQGWGHLGPVGAGHYAKMVHNGIEYGMMQAYAEGFEILKAKNEFHYDLEQIAQVWQFGSVIRSWLLDLTAKVFSQDQELDNIQGWVEDTGEGRWTVLEAIDLDLSAPVITAALQRRLRSRQESPFSDKLLAALRNQFGGHNIKLEHQE